MNKRLLFLLLVGLSLLAACTGEQQTIIERDKTLGERIVDSNFLEAKQIQAIEEWKDNPGKIVNVYLINPVTGSLLVPPVQCQGVPASSTESLEPNEAVPWGGSSTWKINLEGFDAGTTEMAGRDGTFGEPVPFRQCLSVEGHYYDFPAMGLPYLVSSAIYTFPDATVQRDFESEARLLAAEVILRRGGCVNFETLVEIECKK